MICYSMWTALSADDYYGDEPECEEHDVPEDDDLAEFENEDVAGREADLAWLFAETQVELDTFAAWVADMELRYAHQEHEAV